LTTKQFRKTLRTFPLERHNPNSLWVAVLYDGNKSKPNTWSATGHSRTDVRRKVKKMQEAQAILGWSYHPTIRAYFDDTTVAFARLVFDSFWHEDLPGVRLDLDKGVWPKINDELLWNQDKYKWERKALTEHINAGLALGVHQYYVCAHNEYMEEPYDMDDADPEPMEVYSFLEEDDGTREETNYLPDSAD
jgi:hypothetical protein